MEQAIPVGVIGSGAMGSGIAQVAAEAGHEVLVFDNNPSALERADTTMRGLFAGLVAKGKRTPAESEATVSRIRYVGKLPDLDDAGLVVEAIVEDLDVKRRVFEDLSHALASDCVFATNTSSLSVTAIAAAAENPARVLGLHFFNPAPLMRLVEVVPAAQTDPSVTERMLTLMRGWGKTPVRAQDTPGFIVNRVARPYYSEALRLLDEGLAEPHDVDAAMEAIGFRMGPFTLMDFIGHDVNFAVTESMFHAYWGEARYRPSFSQRRLVDAGYLGRKAGRGFYAYDAAGKPVRPATELDPAALKRLSDRILLVLINEAADALHFRVARAGAIDEAMLLGVNYPRGLLDWGRELGHAELVRRLDVLFERYHEARYRVSPALRGA